MNKTLLRKEMIKQARLELARRDFFEYCKLTAPDFYKEDRIFLKDMCNQLQKFYESDNERIMVINLPPRHGKSRTAGKLVEWIFGQNNHEKVMTGSYNEILSGTFAKSVRDEIASEKTEGVLMLSRTETGFKLIIIMTRWASNDLAGYMKQK